MGNCCSAYPDDTPQYNEKINPVKVSHVWLKIRGKSSDQTTRRIGDIIKNADKNEDGNISETEALGLCKQFLKTSGAEAEDDDYNEEQCRTVFTQLDTSGNGNLEPFEVETGMKAMWLMKRDAIKIDQLCGDMPAPEALPKLSQSLVDQKWKELRGEAPGPDDKAVTRAINKSDKGKKGALNPPEAIRITKAFIKKAGAVNLGIGSHETSKVFHYLDTNGDGVLNKAEVKLAMKAMWLLDGKEVEVAELLEYPQ